MNFTNIFVYKDKVRDVYIKFLGLSRILKIYIKYLVFIDFNFDVN